MAAPSEEAVVTCSSCPDRGIYYSIHPRISMLHLSIMPFTLPQWGIRGAQTVIRLLNVLMTLWPLIDCSHKFNSPCCKDSHLPVTACKRAHKHTHTCTKHHLPELIEAEIQSSCKMAICVSQKVWDVFTIMSDEGNLQERKGSKFKQCSIA